MAYEPYTIELNVLLRDLKINYNYDITRRLDDFIRINRNANDEFISDNFKNCRNAYTLRYYQVLRILIRKYRGKVFDVISLLPC